jgi:hypothetical protein
MRVQMFVRERRGYYASSKIHSLNFGKRAIS